MNSDRIIHLNKTYRDDINILVLSGTARGGLTRPSPHGCSFKAHTKTDGRTDVQTHLRVSICNGRQPLFSASRE